MQRQKAAFQETFNGEVFKWFSKRVVGTKQYKNIFHGDGKLAVPEGYAALKACIDRLKLRRTKGTEAALSVLVPSPWLRLSLWTGGVRSRHGRRAGCLECEVQAPAAGWLWRAPPAKESNEEEEQVQILWGWGSLAKRVPQQQPLPD